MKKKIKVCVVIPSYKVKNIIEKVVKKIDFKLINKVIIVDDCCPENTGSYMIKKNYKRVDVIINKKNLGVGGATLIGFKKAIKMKFDIVFKIDGDNQHEPKDLKRFIKFMQKPDVNFCKGTRFVNSLEKKKIPIIRLMGNTMLTYLSRINCRNNNLTDVVNGFVGIKINLLKKLNFKLISKDFFFEEDLLFRVSFIEKKIYELPIKVIYNNKSNLNPITTIIPFILKHIKNFLIRLKYDSFVKN